jgi:MFS family permease
MPGNLNLHRIGGTRLAPQSAAGTAYIMTDHLEDGQAAPKEPDYLLSAQFALLLLATAFFGLSFSAYFLLPKFLATELAAEPSTIGAVSAITMFASVVFMPLVGIQVDRRGRKFFGCAGALTFAVASAGYLVIDSVGPLLWVVRILQGIAFTLFYIALSTLATEQAPPRRLGQAIGLFGAVMISTNALGPALAEWVSGRYGWPVVFGATVVTATLSAALTLLIRERFVEHPHAESVGMLGLLRRPGLKRVLTVAVMVGWTMGGLFTFYQPWALERGIEQVSGFLIAFAGCAMLVRTGLGGLADRLGRMRVATAALFFYVGVPFSLIWIDQIGLVLSGSLLGLSHGLFFPALNAVALDFAHARERGKAMAAYHGAFNVGFAAGSYLLGYVAMASDYPTVFAVAGATCLSAFVLLATTAKPGVPDSG